MSQPLYTSTPVVPLSRAPQSAQFTQMGSADPFPAQAVHACQVLARVLQRLPRPESVQLFTADHWSTPWLQVHLYPDPDDAQLAAYQYALGGRLTRTRRDGDAHSVVYTELATEFDQVRIQVWNVNESAPGEPPERADPEVEAALDSATSDGTTPADTPEERADGEAAEEQATDEAGEDEISVEEADADETPEAALAIAADDAS